MATQKTKASKMAKEAPKEKAPKQIVTSGKTVAKAAPKKKLNKQDEVEDADHLTIKEKEQITNAEEQKKVVNSLGNAHDEEDEELEGETSSDYRDEEQEDDKLSHRDSERHT